MQRIPLLNRLKRKKISKKQKSKDEKNSEIIEAIETKIQKLEDNPENKEKKKKEKNEKNNTKNKNHIENEKIDNNAEISEDIPENSNLSNSELELNNKHENNIGEVKTSKIKKRKYFNNNTAIANKFSNKTKDNIIDTITISKNFNFDNFNLSYSWKDMDFITNFTKKIERGNIIYLVCTKRGNKNEKCKGKAKFDRKTGKVVIYNKCVNDKNLHTTINYEEFLK